MKPPGLHVPPVGNVASARTWTAPLPISIFFNLPLAKKPNDRPSGDQNGAEALSVSERGRAISDESGLTHSLEAPLSEATNASCRPSGAIAKFGTTND